VAGEDEMATHAKVDGHLPNLAAANAEKEGAAGEGRIRAAITANVWVQIEDLIKNREIVRDRLKSGKVSVVGVVYDIDSGKVNFPGAHPHGVLLGSARGPGKAGTSLGGTRAKTPRRGQGTGGGTGFNGRFLHPSYLERRVDRFPPRLDRIRIFQF
jgi:hypothetical protein